MVVPVSLVSFILPPTREKFGSTFYMKAGGNKLTKLTEMGQA